MFVDRVGLGGLALLWNKDIQVDFLSFSSNHIDVEVVERIIMISGGLLTYYGYPEASACVGIEI